MSKPVYVLIGMTGAGKTHIANIVAKELGVRRIKNTTTRPQRNEQDNEYNFVSKEEFLQDSGRYIAVRKYTALIEGAPKDYYYGVDKIEFERGGLMITDFEGLKELSRSYDKVVGIYIYADKETRLNRAMNRPGFNPQEFERRNADDMARFKIESIVEFGRDNLIYIITNNDGSSIDYICDKVSDIIYNYK